MAIDRSSAEWPESETVSIPQHSGFKANLLQNARYQMAQTGGRVIVRGEHVRFIKADGNSCVVWFPFDSRVRDLEIADMREAIEYMSGHKAFTL